MGGDEAVLPRMLDVLRGEAVDIVVGSRYLTGGSLGDWARAKADGPLGRRPTDPGVRRRPP